jgi:hypothetical protein
MGPGPSLSTLYIEYRTKPGRPVCAPDDLRVRLRHDCAKAVWLAQLPAMRTDQPRMNIRRAALILAAGIITASCSEKSAPEQEKNADEAVRESEVNRAENEDERQPDQDQIGEDCAAFVRSTRVVPARTASTDCPGCPAGGTEVLSFRQMKTDAVSCSGDTCTAVVTIFSVFNPGSGQAIAGGLTAWIPPEQRSAYLSGQTPSGEQAYRVKITYKRHGDGWRAVEFDRAPVE